MPERIDIEPGVLTWARTSAGLGIDAAAKKITVSEATLSSWEAGELSPTIRQLRKAATVYGRPLAVLLLSEPPQDFAPIRDFRRMPGGVPSDWSPKLRSEFRRAVSQREVYLELQDLFPAVLDESSEQHIEFGTDVEKVALEIRNSLNLGAYLPDSVSSRKLLNAYIDAAEGAGHIVVQTQGVSVSEMRGFSIAQWPYPVIALNGSDWPSARLFTLAHELAHLALDASGMCDLHEGMRFGEEIDDVEHYCNSVAAAVLMPAEVLLRDPEVALATEATRWSADGIFELARQFGVSSEALLIRLISLGKARWKIWHDLKPEIDARYRDALAQQKATMRAAKGGPTFYVIKARDLGHGYVSTVLEAFDARAISSIDVADYLEVRFDQLAKLREVIRA